MQARPKSQAGISLVESLIALTLLSGIGYFTLSGLNKTQKVMFKGSSRDAHAQIISVAKHKSGKALEQILKAANNNPASIGSILDTDLDLGEDISLRWAKPAPGQKFVSMSFAPNPNSVAQKALKDCKDSRTFVQAWQGGQLQQRLHAHALTFCGQMLMPAAISSPTFSAQNIARAKFGFFQFDVTFTRTLNGTPINLSSFGAGGTLATVTWTMVWSYDKAQDTVQQFRKGVYYIVP